MIVIDGSQGEGGGQIFRTALSLAMCLGKPVRIENIRSGRSRSGLLRQHLACLRAAKEISGAKVAGDALGSSVVTFEPGAVKSGAYRFAVGSAGSTTLVFQTVLMPLLLTDGVSTLYLQGGTHNAWAPSYDFIEKCFLPVLARMGCSVAVDLKKYGFYPAGGGDWRVRIVPTKKIQALTLMQRGEVKRKEAVALSARIPTHVIERELNRVKKKCYWENSSLHQKLVSSDGPGNMLSLRVNTGDVTEVFESVGERNIRAERVAERAISALKRYMKAGVPVGEHLADQLLLPMALGNGGCFRTLKPSQHLLTNIQVIKAISGIKIELSEHSEDDWEIVVNQGGLGTMTDCRREILSEHP
ncbi:RNA 3'-terminal phosphate cyclase [Microbulbifer spongiae]|uniref:RNA 3'-terminal phosphate cyclase n=1 Tax=Microbulbifer spongiae TaxID=2944933 RepID=A0ABY9EAW5_9GAMM|nr:RNA 3'-terminal phosphate cyclase [Microbulbifer sp. MI-G]WKD50145.1 RNA 3'-terminal phosphate cyclase [Microbulbifer sp. MI-G]